MKCDYGRGVQNTARGTHSCAPPISIEGSAILLASPVFNDGHLIVNKRHCGDYVRILFCFDLC